MATGLPDKMFNQVIAFVEPAAKFANKSTAVFSTPRKFGYTISDDAQNVLAYLDMFFQGDINRA